MADDSSPHGAPTRREYVKYGGTVIGGGLLAGCAGQGDGGSTPTETETDESTATESSTPEDQSYSVTISPMGSVEFDEVPERVVAYDGYWTDHLIALGQQDRIVAMGFPDRYYTGFYDRLQGVSFDKSGITAMYNEGSYDKELLYELQGDVHHMDPYRAMAFNDNFDADDVEEIVENVGPWFANRGSRFNTVPGGKDVEYEFYTLWELLSKFAQVYQVQDRSAALKSVRDEMVEHIQSNLPPEDDRPNVGLALWWDGDIWAYPLNSGGFGKAHLRPVQANDVFSDVSGLPEDNYVKIDAEEVLDADPDVWIQHNALNSADQFVNESIPQIKDDPVLGEVTAVKNDRIYPGGTGLQGPLYNLFQIEMTAKQVYPELFGEFPGVGEPVPEEEQLFDRQRVADIVNGEI
jgi:ABC-type Fe3+-hydroxamate transport system substrate-binding protein